MPWKTIHSIHAVLGLVQRTDEELWQGLVNVQCRKPPEVVTSTSEVLDELGLEEKATQLRGRLVCQSLSGKWLLWWCHWNLFFYFISDSCVWGVPEEIDFRRRPTWFVWPMVRDTENLPFSADTPHRFSEGSCVAIRGRPCGSARIANAEMRRSSARRCADAPQI